MIFSKLGYTKENGLVLCNDDYEGVKNNAEKLYLSEIKDLDPYAILFRRYYKDELEIPYHSEPSVCIFREKDVPFNSERHFEIHSALWSEGKNEIYIIFGKNRVDIYNARKPAEVNNLDQKNKKIFNDLALASGAIDKLNKDLFKAELFGNGTFWEQDQFKNELDEENSPHIHLLNYLMSVRDKFLNQEEIKLKPATIDKLLVVSILVKFLEEIKDPGGNFHTLRDIYAEKDVDSFVDAIKSGLILEIFDELAAEFNGKIFNKFDAREKEIISNSKLDLLAQFLRADIELDTKQLFLWEQYSFRHLPPEVISSIYENFTQAEAKRKRGTKEKGVVYTPIHLVNFLVDEVMPLNKAGQLFEDRKFKVLDPACGSGVFLVAAYKRLLQWWAINKSQGDEIRYPDAKVAQKILEENIFGVDVKETATLVSIFSLTTALLDKLNPKEVWGELTLKDLTKKNIQQKNFFEWASEFKSTDEKFDLVIGNPPFNPETNKKKDYVLSSTSNLNLKRQKIPYKDFALYFFETSIKLSKKICMIVPSNPLLYSRANTAHNYRRHIFSDFTIKDIYDFTHLREVLFAKQNQNGQNKSSGRKPVIAIIGLNKPSDGEVINHTIVKRMIHSEKKIRFEIDYYDQHKVPLNWAIDPEKQFIWKTNLLGGGRLFQLINRLNMLPSLKKKINKNGWKEDRGFEGRNKEKLKNKDRIVSIKNGNPIVEYNVDIEAKKLKDKFMYSPPFLIIEHIIGDDKLSSCFISKDNELTQKKHLFYNRNFVGISAPASDENELKKLNDAIQNAPQKKHLNFQLFVLAKSSNCLVQHDTSVRKGDILSIPDPAQRDYLNLSETESIVQEDVLNYYMHMGKAISDGSLGEELHQKASKEQLLAYGKVVCDTLNYIYKTQHKSWQVGKVFQTSNVTIFQVGFGEKNGLNTEFLKELDVNTDSLIKNFKSNQGAVFKRVARFYNHQEGYDCIYFVKPNAKYYWLKSIALRDADDTFVEFKDEGF